MNHYALSRHVTKLIGLTTILLGLIALQPTESTYSAPNTIPPFAPSGHFETNFLPKGSLSVATKDLLFLYDGSDLMRSENGGATWRTMTKPVTTANLHIIVPSPNLQDDQIVFAGSDYGFHLSFDHGYTWRYPQEPINGAVRDIVVSPHFAVDHTVFALGSDSLKVSVDGGEHWQARTLPQAYFPQDLILSPSDSTNQTLYLHSYHYLDGYSLWRSVNGGNSWSRADVGLETSNGVYYNMYDLKVISPNSAQDQLFVATSHGVYTSYNQGQEWQLLSTKVFYDLLVPADIHITQTFLGIELNTAKVYRTTNMGNSWVPQLPNQFITDGILSTNYLVDQAVMVRSRDKLWVSTNMGASWQQVSGPLAVATYAGVYQIVLSPDYESDGIVFAAAGLAGGTDDDTHLLRSNDFGQTWTIHELSGTGHIQIGISPNFDNDGTVWLTRNEKLYRSTDRGLHWTFVTSLPFTSFFNYTRIQLSPDYANDQTIFVSHYLRGLYRSTNNGATWTQLATGLSTAILRFAISPDYANDATLYLSIKNEGLYRSTNNGVTWQLVNSPGGRLEEEIALSPDFAQDDTLFAIKENGQGLYRSTNRGDTWTEITVPDLNYDVGVLVVSPRFAQDQTIISGRNYGPLYISEDAGATWFQMDHLTGVGGLTYNRGGLTLGYKNGFLQPIVGSNGIQFYQWPTHIRPTTALGIPMVPNSPGPTTLSYYLPQYDQEIHWTAAENIPWLTATPLEGELTTPLQLTVDHTATTFPASANFTMRVYYSWRQGRNYTVPVMAFYAPHQAYFPMISR